MPTQTVSPVAYLFLWGPIILVFYFLFIRPQQIKEREHQKMLASLQKNDAVVTSSGIHGVITNVKERTVILRIDDNVKIEIEKSCIAYKKKEPENNLSKD